MCGDRLWFILQAVLFIQLCVAVPVSVQLERCIDELHWTDSCMTSSYKGLSSAVDRTAMLGTLHHLVLTLLTLEAEYINNVTQLVHPEATRWLRVRPLSAHQVELVGSLAFSLSYYEAAVRWLEAADVMRQVTSAPASPSADTGAEDPMLFMLENPQHLTTTFSTLCAQAAHTAQVDRHLTCRLQRRRVDYGSWQLEVQSENPEVVYIHDMLHHTEVEAVLSASKSQLTDSEIIGYKNGSEKDAGVRHSQSAWLEETSPVTRRIASIITDVTNMDTEWKETSSNTENLQVLRYGPGGVYHPHYDFMENSPVPDYIKGSGDRIATFLIYLQAPSIGGSTVFPLLDVVVEPQKGGAVFWYNLLKSGKPDRRTLHGGCPVTQGEKWVAAKWIHERGQMFARPCGPHVDS